MHLTPELHKLAHDLAAGAILEYAGGASREDEQVLYQALVEALEEFLDEWADDMADAADRSVPRTWRT
jgi:hypothetical protein